MNVSGVVLKQQVTEFPAFIRGSDSSIASAEHCRCCAHNFQLPPSEGGGWNAPATSLEQSDSLRSSEVAGVRKFDQRTTTFHALWLIYSL
jgi:hypothetical protein